MMVYGQFLLTLRVSLPRKPVPVASCMKAFAGKNRRRLSNRHLLVIRIVVVLAGLSLARPTMSDLPAGVRFVGVGKQVVPQRHLSSIDQDSLNLRASEKREGS